MKTARRGARGGGRGDFMGGHQMQQGQQYPPQQQGQLFPPQQQGQQFPPHQQGQQFPPQQPGGFPMMPGFPPFDPNDPMAAMMAMQGMQGMGFPQMPGMPMPGMPGPPGQPGVDQIPQSNQRCPFYDTQGICYLGNTCPYQHGEGGVSKDDGKRNSFILDIPLLTVAEYDPKTAGMHAQRGGAPMRGDRGRGRSRGGFSGRGRGRSDFSSAGPNEDQSVTTIVVEQIPDEKFNEDSVREFFSEFGNITEVSLQPYKKIALVKYETFPEAKAAWSSPKVIFDNRFVKVYWYKPNREEKHDSAQPEAPAFNQEEFEKQQLEAQRAHEEKMKKRQETEAAKQALERQRDELIKKQQEERARLMQRLGGTTDTSDATGAGDAMATEPADENISDETKQLRAQLAALEAEAKSLGLDPAADPSGRGGYRGRGGFRGRGTYRGRGAYDPNFRGGYRGRGGFAARGRGGVLRLDNRPRRVAVSGVELNSDKDEALRQHLMVSHVFFEPSKAYTNLLCSRALANTNLLRHTQTSPTPSWWHSKSASRPRSSCSLPGTSPPWARSNSPGWPTRPLYFLPLDHQQNSRVALDRTNLKTQSCRPRLWPTPHLRGIWTTMLRRMTAGGRNSVTFCVPSCVGCIGCIKLFLWDGRSIPDLLSKPNSCYDRRVYKSRSSQRYTL